MKQRGRERDETRRDKTVKLDTPSRLRAFAGSGDWSEPEPDQRELRRGTRSPTPLRSFDPARFPASMARASHDNVKSFTHNEKNPSKCLVQPQNHEHRSLVRYLKFPNPKKQQQQASSSKVPPRILRFRLRLPNLTLSQRVVYTFFLFWTGGPPINRTKLFPETERQ